MVVRRRALPFVLVAAVAVMFDYGIVQDDYVQNDPEPTSQAFGSNVVAGNVIVAAATWSAGATAPVPTWSDTQTNAYTSFGAPECELFAYCVGGAWAYAGSAGALTVTIDLDITSTVEYLYVAEVSGLAASTPADGYDGNQAVAGTSPFTVGTLTAADASGLLISGTTCGTSDTSAGAGYTALLNDSANQWNLTMHSRYTSSGSKTGTITWAAGTQACTTFLAALAEPAAGGSACPVCAILNVPIRGGGWLDLLSVVNPFRPTGARVVQVASKERSQ